LVEARLQGGFHPVNPNQYNAMINVLIRHKITDFAKWKSAYDAHAHARQAAGLKEEHLWRNLDNPNEVLILFTAADINKARTFSNTPDLREAMQNAGVMDKPDIYFLE